jgi:lipopolysaccharide/colanic/teichoic acid biosynthesis glycosyltransferase
MLKRFVDIVISSFGLIVTAPVLLSAMLLVWWEDGRSPLYVSNRVGRGGFLFQMVKIRSMVIGADINGASSTSNNDRRITSIGRFIRRYKIDELAQLWNVLIGDMSLVGPRPQVQSGVDRYTRTENNLLSVRPGVTDFASIVFSDEGSILEGHSDPDAAYDQLIRPGKSLLGLFYLDKRSFRVDLWLIWLTVVTLFSRQRALKGVQSLLESLDAPPNLRRLASRQDPLIPMLPP